MNATEEQTVLRLRALAEAAAPATNAPGNLAQQVLAQDARPRILRVKPALIAFAALATTGVVAATAVIGNGQYREWTQPSGAMAPTVAVSQVVLVEKDLAPQRGDVVLIELDNGQETFEALSRVVGLPGDSVSCPAEPDGTCRAVQVNGLPLRETWLQTPTEPFEKTEVDAGAAFLLGDARDQAVDSRLIGTQRLDSILGVVVARFVEGGRRQALPGAPRHELPEGGQPIDPANPVPPARAGSIAG